MTHVDRTQYSRCERSDHGAYAEGNQENSWQYLRPITRGITDPEREQEAPGGHERPNGEQQSRPYPAG